MLRCGSFAGAARHPEGSCGQETFVKSTFFRRGHDMGNRAVIEDTSAAAQADDIDVEVFDEPDRARQRGIIFAGR